MENIAMFEPLSVAANTEAFMSYTPVPGYGLLAVNAYLIHAAQPVLVDTGLIGLREQFIPSLRSAIMLEDLCWLWLTHTDPDHMGNLVQILNEAPNLRLVTTYLGMGKMGLYQLPIPLDRVYLVNPGQRLDVGDRELLAVTPPTFDAPETTALLDTKTHAFFSVDSFGAVVAEPVDTLTGIPPSDLRDGMVLWTTADAPWIHRVSEATFHESLDAVRSLEPSIILSSHLPPAQDMTETLLGYLDTARTAPAFVGPDQAAFEAVLAAVQEAGELG